MSVRLLPLPWIVLAVVIGCADPMAPPTGDVCQQATELFARCGVTLPLLSGTPCTGVVHDAAACITAHATNCDDLAAIETKLGLCASDALDGGDLTSPAEDLPVPPLADAGGEDSTAADTSTDAATALVEAGDSASSAEAGDASADQ